MRIGVIGTGHVGLVTCASLASLGHDIVGTDSDTAKIDSLELGECPFYEPGLPELLLESADTGRLTFTHDIARAVTGAEVVFISVGTPQRATGEANLVAVEAAGRAVARHATGRCVVVEKSTVPTGTARMLSRALQRERPDLGGALEVASNPEFLCEGSAVEDALHPDRILVGANSERAHQTMRRVYQTLIDQGCEYIETDIATSELAKHASNAFLAMRISFINALARLSERAGADVVTVAGVLGKDPRIGPLFLNAGLGYGGSCFSKDLQALTRLSSHLGYEFPLLEEIARINEETIDMTVEKIRQAVWNLEGKRIALLGLAFKPGTDDIRFAPALALARRLLAEGSSVVGYDPAALDNALADVAGIEPAANAYEAVEGADCAVLCTEWDEIVGLDYRRVRRLMAYPVFIDGRNCLDARLMQSIGFSYIAMGRPAFGLDFPVQQTAEPMP